MFEIDVADAKKIDNAVFIDVREEEEWNEGHIEGAVHMPLSDLQCADSVALSEDDGPFIIYCRSGKRSLMALSILKEHGIDNARSMAGGYLAWCAIS
jgi:rhodanese-related sulfurtransferase